MANEYNIPSLIQSLRRKLETEQMTMRQVRERLYWAGWFNFVPSEEQAMAVLYWEKGGEQ